MGQETRHPSFLPTFHCQDSGRWRTHMVLSSFSMPSHPYSFHSPAFLILLCGEEADTWGWHQWAPFVLCCSWLGSRKPLAGKLESVPKVCVSSSFSLTGDIPPVPSRSIGWLCSSTKGHVSVSRWSLHTVTPSKFCS